MQRSLLSTYSKSHVVREAETKEEEAILKSHACIH